VFFIALNRGMAIINSVGKWESLTVMVDFLRALQLKMVHSQENAPYELCIIGNLTSQRSHAMSFQAYLDNIEEKTGKTPNDFIAMAKEKGFDNPKTKAAEIVAWLKEDYGLGRGHAMAIV
jgi:hypothetical protein